MERIVSAGGLRVNPLNFTNLMQLNSQLLGGGGGVCVAGAALIRGAAKVALCVFV